MTAMYVANASPHFQEFLYTVADSTAKTGSPLANPRIISHVIPPGGQIRILDREGDDLSDEDIKFILGHHHRYGLVSVYKIDPDIPFAGMCYSVGKPVDFSRLKRLFP